MEVIAVDRDRGELGVRGDHPLRVMGMIDLGVDGQAAPGAGGGDKADDDLVADERANPAGSG